MTKLTRSLALMAALAMLAGGTMTNAQDTKKAEQKKDDKKKDDKKTDDKKDDKKKETAKEKDAVPGGIEIYKGKNGFRWRIVNKEGKTIAMPTANLAWETKDDCLKAFDDVKTIINKAKPADAKD